MWSSIRVLASLGLTISSIGSVVASPVPAPQASTSTSTVAPWKWQDRLNFIVTNLTSSTSLRTAPYHANDPFAGQTVQLGRFTTLTAVSLNGVFSPSIDNLVPSYICFEALVQGVVNQYQICAFLAVNTTTKELEFTSIFKGQPLANVTSFATFPPTLDLATAAQILANTSQTGNFAKAEITGKSLSSSPRGGAPEPFWDIGLQKGSTSYNATGYSAWNVFWTSHSVAYDSSKYAVIGTGE